MNVRIAKGLRLGCLDSFPVDSPSMERVLTFREIFARVRVVTIAKFTQEL
jgi:hypothetical protein